MKRILFPVIAVAAFYAQASLAQGYPSRDPNDLLHGGAVENGAHRQPSQAEIEARQSARNTETTAAAPQGTRDIDQLYDDIKRQSHTTILGTAPSAPGNP